MSNSDNKSIAVDRLAIIGDVYSQLHEGNIDVQGNPVSVVPVFALEVLYSLRWRTSAAIFSSLVDPAASQIPMDTALIEIRFIVPIPGNPQDVLISSRWKLSGCNLSVVNKVNDSDSEKEISFSSERDKYEKAVKYLKDLVLSSIIATLNKSEKN